MTTNATSDFDENKWEKICWKIVVIKNFLWFFDIWKSDMNEIFKSFTNNLRANDFFAINIVFELSKNKKNFVANVRKCVKIEYSIFSRKIFNEKNWIEKKFDKIDNRNDWFFWDFEIKTSTTNNWLFCVFDFDVIIVSMIEKTSCRIFDNFELIKSKLKLENNVEFHSLIFFACSLISW